MTPRFKTIATKHPITWVLLLILVTLFVQMLSMGNEFGYDAFSEATSYQAALNFQRDGFFKHYGLANWGGKQAEIVLERFPENKAITGDSVYIGNPPGPDIVLWGLMNLFGQEKLMLYRLCPLTVAMLALWMLYIALAKSLGLSEAKSALVVLLVGLCNPFRVWTTSLHYQGYGMSLLLLQVALSLMLIGQRPSRNWLYIFFFLVGFVQGANRYDYVFLVALSPLVIGLMAGSDKPLISKAHLIGSGLSLLGFAAADTLYLFAVAMHSGGFETLLAKFRERTIGVASRAPINPSDMSLVNLIQEYLKISTFFRLGFLFNVVAASLIWAGANLTSERLQIRIRAFLGHPPREVLFSMNRNRAYALILANVAGWGWVFLFRQHAFFHSWLLYTHFFLTYIALVFLMVKQVSFKTTS